jgi:hypothetical protein
MMRVIGRDIRYATRALLRHPMTTAVALVTLAVGIGAVTTMFTVVNATLIRALPFDRPDELFEILRLDITVTVVVGLAACPSPASRTAGLDPVCALRQ